MDYKRHTYTKDRERYEIKKYLYQHFYHKLFILYFFPLTAFFHLKTLFVTFGLYSHLCDFLTLCLFVCFWACLFACVSVCLFVYLPLCLFVGFSICRCFMDCLSGTSVQPLCDPLVEESNIRFCNRIRSLIKKTWFGSERQKHIIFPFNIKVKNYCTLITLVNNW